MRHERSDPSRRLLAVPILAALWIGITPAQAEDGTITDSAAVTDQLAGIRVELQNIAQMLGALEQHNRVTALMTRIRLKQQRLTSIEGELRSARGEQEGTEQEIERLTAIEQSWTDEEGTLGGEGLGEGARRELELLRQEKKSLESRVETLRLRIVELENDFRRAQDDILALEETVDEQLGLR